MTTPRPVGVHVAAWALVGLVIASACGARSNLEVGGGPGPGPGAGGAGNGGGSGGDGGDGGADGGGGIGPGGCVVFNSLSTLAPADLSILVDSSGSMEFQIQPGVTKWDAMSTALSSFFSAPESAGVAASLTFFPIVNFSVPQYCTSDTTCGEPESCFPRRICPEAFSSCFSDEDCDILGFPDDVCEPLGRCSTDQSQFCVPSGASGLGCTTGTCEPTMGCDNVYTCQSSAYAQTVSGAVSLPAGGSSLVSFLNAQPRQGGTPTLPALTGVLDGAIGHAAEHPSHKGLVVLITDGFPTVCDPDLYSMDPDAPLDNLVAVASGGAAQGVETFVIGVFTPLEQVKAEQNLGAIAAAGGTESAFVISTSGNVAAEFLEALNQVRAEAQACEFELVTDGEIIDFATVWVRIYPDGTDPVWIPYVGSAQACAPDTHGFYYDVLPGQGTPSRVIMCPDTCDLVSASEEPIVEVYTECDPTDERER